MIIAYNEKIFPDDLVVQSILEAVLGEEITSLELEKRGSVNKTEIVTTKENKYFCKIAPSWYKGSLERERWCLDLLRKKRQNVPQVVKLIIQDDIEILLMEYLEGNTFSNCDRRTLYFNDILDIYKVIHSVEMKKFGWLNSAMVGLKSTWKSFLLDIENLPTLESSSYWSKKTNFVLSEIEKYSFNFVEPVLLYGDYNRDNFICKDEKIYALDFQNCFSGDYLYDYGIIFSKESRLQKEILTDLKSEEIVILYLYSLRHLLSMTSYALINKNYSRLNFIRSKFNLIEEAYEGIK